MGFPSVTIRATSRTGKGASRSGADVGSGPHGFPQHCRNSCKWRRLTSAETFADTFGHVPSYHFDDSAYKARVYEGFGKAEPKEKLYEGPNIKAWPELPALGDNILLRVCSKIEDPVTTTDELIPSGETSSYRSNPLGLAEFTLSRRDPQYVGRTKAVKELELAREKGEDLLQKDADVAAAFTAIHTISGSGRCYSYPIRKSVLSFTPINRVMAVLVNRQPAVSASSAALPTSLVNMRPNGIAATSSTGGCCPFI